MTDKRSAASRVDRSDSGPVGFQIRNAMGLDDAESLDEVLETTKAAIATQRLRDLVRVDRGGYGVVCKAVDESTGNPRAIKVVLHPEDEDRLTIFRRECRMLDAAEMPTGIGPKFYGAHEPPGAQPFLIQEWIEGRKLSDWLDAHPDLSMSDRESLCRAIFDTYSRLHAANLIHRDVSLGNIMISGRKVRLIDFGGGGRAAPGYRSINTMSRVPTTEAFISDPVRSGDRKPTIPDEVHAVAKVCFTVLTGQLAFGKSQKERQQAFQAARVSADIIAILLPKMENPPEKLAMQSQAKEF